MHSITNSSRVKAASRLKSFVTTAAASLVVATSSLSQADASPVGEILLVAGQCPAGYLPADGRVVDAGEYPELAAVLNEADAVRFADLRPIFEGEEPGPGGDLPGPISAVLFELVSEKGRSALRVDYNVDRDFVNLSDAEGILKNVQAYAQQRYSASVTGEFALTTKLVDNVKPELVYKDGSIITGFDPADPQFAWILFDESTFKFTTDNFIGLADLLKATQQVATRSIDSASAIDSAAAAVADSSFTPRYCVAAGGDTAPLVEVGLELVQGTSFNDSELVFKRVDVSGFLNVPPGFLQGNIDLAALQRFNPGIGRPNVRFRIVNENACRAFERFRYPIPGGKGKDGRLRFDPSSAYPGELRMSGVQIAIGTGGYPTADEWGNDFDRQRENLLNGGSVNDASFTYTTKRDERGRPGFVAADIVDERTLVLENRNIAQASFSYRVQAQCGDGDSAYNVYYDPQIQHDGRGGSGGFPY